MKRSFGMHTVRTSVVTLLHTIDKSGVHDVSCFNVSSSLSLQFYVLFMSMWEGEPQILNQFITFYIVSFTRVVLCKNLKRLTSISKCQMKTQYYNINIIMALSFLKKEDSWSKGRETTKQPCFNDSIESMWMLWVKMWKSSQWSTKPSVVAWWMDISKCRLDLKKVSSLIMVAFFL